MKRVIIPIDLGGSPTACALRPPRRKADVADTVGALVSRYRQERTGDRWEVAFFHGGLPTSLQLSAIQGLPARLSCSPADLSSQAASRLYRAGVQTIELEVGTFQSRVLKKCRRGYGPARVWTMISGLQDMGYEVGLTLNPGLPGYRTEDCIQDADLLAADTGEKVSFVRLNPALALAGSLAARWVESGLWDPMTVSEAVHLTRRMADTLEAAGIPIARVGLQPGQDIPVPVIAGPAHPNLRSLIQMSRFRDRLASALRDFRAGQQVEVHVNPKDLSVLKGADNMNIREARVNLELSKLVVVSDPAIPRGQVRAQLREPEGQTG